MAEYVERDALLRKIKRYGLSDGSVLGKHSGAAEGLILEVELFPSADVTPVRRGHWKSKVNPQWRAYSHDECSICGWWNTRDAMCYDGNRKPGHSLNYCPNCGAKMEVEHDN